MARDEHQGSANVIATLLVQVYEIHEVIVGETGGLSGLRDAAMLHSAVARPFATYQGKELYTTDFDKAAALFHSLIKNHPFMDGTKRTAFASALFFLSERGYAIPKQIPVNETVEFCVSVAEENLRASETLQVGRTVPEIAEWFQRLLNFQ